MQCAALPCVDLTASLMPCRHAKHRCSITWLRWLLREPHGEDAHLLPPVPPPSINGPPAEWTQGCPCGTIARPVGAAHGASRALCAATPWTCPLMSGAALQTLWSIPLMCECANLNGPAGPGNACHPTAAAAVPPPPSHQRGLVAFRCRVHLAATCRTLRAASLHWFRRAVIPLDPATPSPRQIAWLRRVKGEHAVRAVLHTPPTPNAASAHGQVCCPPPNVQLLRTSLRPLMTGTPLKTCRRRACALLGSS